MRTGPLKLALLVAAPALLPAASHAQWKTPWSYNGARGPEHWGDLDPDYAACKTGKQQSPIDIRGAEKGDLPAIRFEYQSAPLKYLINNGYTIRVNYHDAPGSGNFLIVGDTRYHLTQFHFHRPSEETIHGKPYAMEVHLMHQSSDGKVIGVTVLLKIGSANATVQRIWDRMPTSKGNEEEIPGVEVNPSGLLPRQFDYYMYEGSITAPPCTEGVTWFVLKDPVTVSAEQIKAFARLYPDDVRPIQPLNGRVVKESR
ncbi:MAG: carbonic anhydrase family protein [Terracidiphilus sp.]